MWKSQRLFAILLAACLLPQPACFLRRAKPQELKSPYQLALEAYYRAVDQNPSDLSPALQAANDLLAKTPADMEARSLRTQIYLRMVDPLNPKSRAPLVNDLREIIWSVGERSPSPWVEPRAWVTTGDLLTMAGNAWIQAIQDERTSTPERKTDLYRAYEIFDAARSFYAKAGALVGDAKTPPALVREKEHARDGYLRATEGVLNALNLVDPNSSRRKDLLIELKGILEEGPIGQQTPGIARVDFRDHEAQRRVYSDLDDITFGEWCATKTGAPTAWQQGRERALLHADLAWMLNPGAPAKPDDVIALQNLQRAYDPALKPAERCP